jgi:hypothetical protein
MLLRYKPDIFTDIPGIKHYFPQAVPVILKLCRMAGISNTVDRMATWNESCISSGLLRSNEQIAHRDLRLPGTPRQHRGAMPAVLAWFLLVSACRQEDLLLDMA